MLLEEAILHLLRRSGYQTVDGPGRDPTLCSMAGGTGVHGRGTDHQIDAIADFVVNQPFSNPQRLMVEAKCKAVEASVGIDVVRNAVGVLKDITEYWRPPHTGPNNADCASRPPKRFHYQYAVFSATSFSRHAQQFAFAHDIHLFPLNRSQFFEPILNAIRESVPNGENLLPPEGGLSQVRKAVRGSLHHGSQSANFEFAANLGFNAQPFLKACWELNYSLVAILGGQFTILLTPSEAMRTQHIDDRTMVRIRWNQEGWFLEREGRELFSFDLPEELFNLYAESGKLNPRRALDLKMQWMKHIQTIEIRGQQPRLLTFSLDQDWIEAIRTSKQGST